MQTQPDPDVTGLRLSAEVADALRAGRPVVALESTVLAHGLPRPHNLAVARRMEDAVRAGGAVPATVAVLAGAVRVGLDDDALTHLAGADDVRKVSARDLPVAAALGIDGATTVAGTAAVAARAGIGVLATGGLGGVHRGAADTHDESADLFTLARTPIAVVCAGVKSILDVAATLERLESYGVTVLGYRTDRFPGFYLADSGHRLDWRVERPEQVAAVLATCRGWDASGAVVVAQPIPADAQLDPADHDRVLAEALAGLARDGVTGKDVTPYLLTHVHRATAGRSLAVNTTVLLRNADLAARIAVAASGWRPTLRT